MNKNLHRVIFNKSRGMRMVVQETASSVGKASCGHTQTGSAPSELFAAATGLGGLVLKPLAVAAALLLGSHTGFAQIIADPSAPGRQRPTVLESANGTPTVNIQTPSAAGVSRNTYQQFDIGQKGAILNNSRTDVQTQLGGWIQGNAGLANGSAKVIVNEVNSAAQSKLMGTLEVAGQRADVIIANPSGLVVDGLSFINAAGVTLSTGRLLYGVNGSVDGFNIQGGQIGFQGSGMDATKADYATILARAISVNAGLWAKDLRVATGLNQTDASGNVQQRYSSEGMDASQKPKFALDVAQLGGMYAGKIFIVGTEAGLGVRNAGTLAAQGEGLLLQTDGTLLNAGKIQASTSLTIQARDSVQNTSADAAIISGTDLSITAAAVDAKHGSLMAAGVDAQGKVGQNGNLLLAATTSIDLQGQIVAAGAAELQAGQVALVGADLSAKSARISASHGDLTASGASINVLDTFEGSASGQLRTSGGKVVADHLVLQATSLNNAGGALLQTGVNDMSLHLAQSLDNSAGTISTNAENLSIHAGQLSNAAGQITHAGNGTLTIAIDGALDGRQGIIQSQGSAVIRVADANLDKGNLDAQQLNFEAASLTTQGAQIIQRGQLLGRVAVSGDWNNADGLTWFNSDASISAGTLTNRGGQLASTQSLVLAVDGRLANQHGSIAAGKDITASADALDNTSGVIGTQQGNLHLTSRQDVVNDSGALQASDGVQISSRSLRNGKASGAADGGVISGKTVVLDTGGALLDNALGTIAATDALTIHAGDLGNQQGFISTAGTLAIDAYALSNTSGKIGSADSLSVTADSLDNGGGQIQSQGGQALHVDQALINTEGLIRSGDALALQAASITNNTTSGVDQGIEGNAVTLKTALLNNEHGAIRAGDAIELQSSGVLLNAQGLISATNRVALVDASSTKSLAIDNTQAMVIAGQHLEVGAKSLTGNGQVLSHGDIDISLTTDFVNTSAVMANRDLTLRTTANVSNTGQLQAGNNLALSASDLSNASGAEVIGVNTRLQVHNTFTNRGLVDGETARIDAGTLLNLGTGRLYGDRLAIQASKIVNGAEAGTAASIAARSSLDMGSVSLVNRDQALLFSAGDAAIGGALNADGTATGSADTITNSGASIEAIGNLQISARSIENLNSNFSLATGTTVSESKHEVLLSYLDKRLDYDKVYFYAQKENDSYIGATMASHVERSDGEQIYMAMGDCGCLVPGPFTSGWQEYSYTRDTTTDVVASSAPGRITSGGNLVVRGGLVNDKSQVIAGQTLDVSGASVKNIDAVGRRTTVDKGSVRAHTYRRGHAHGIDWWLDWLDYDPGAQVDDVNLAVTSFLGNTAGAVSGSIAGPSQVTPVSAVVSTTGTPVVNVKGNVQQVNPQGPSSGSGAHTVIRTTLPNTAVPASSLYHAAASTAGYLIETDPQFTNRGKWLGSDYLLSALNQDPALLQKRLGDGFYEQRLVREQVAELTGRRFIDGYANDEAQYQALMQSGATFARKWDLVPGVALSAEQMAQLTSDIVWLVEKTVVLPDGSTTSALVPQVYMRVQDGDLDGTGTLLAGAQVNIKAEGGLLNTGTIAGRQAVVLDAHNVQNLAGRITGGTVAISAALDVDNIGARIDADKALSIQAGRDINLVTTTTEVSNTVGSAAYSRKTIDRVAGLYVTGADATLQAKAGRDLNLQGAEIINGVLASDAPSGGTTILSAERDANFTTVQTAQSQSLVWDAGNYQKRAHSTEVGTQVQGAGAVIVSAGHDVNTRAAQVTAGSELQLAAGNNLNITAGEATASHDTASKESKSGLLSKKTYVYQSTSSSNTAVASTLSGGTVQMQAGKDIAITGSNVVSDTGTKLVAGNDVTIQAATETHSASHYENVRKSGVFGGGGLTIGKQQQSTDQAKAYTTSAASSVGSAKGDVQIQAGRDIAVVGSEVNALKQTSLAAGRDVTITSAENTETGSSYRASKSSGFSFSKEGLGYSKSSQSGNNSYTAKTQSSSSVTGGEVRVSAGQDVNIQASTVVADEDLNLQAVRNVNIVAGTNTSQSAQESHSKSTSLGGFMPTGLGKGVTFFSNTKTAEDGTHDSTRAVSSTVGSLGGDVNILAGQGYTQTGSDVVAPKGDINIHAQTVAITEARETGADASHQSSSSTTLGARPRNAVVDLVMAAKNTADTAVATSKTGNGRVQAIGAAATALNAYNTANAAMDLAKDPSKATSVSIEFQLGTSKSQSSNAQTSDTGRGSHVSAGGDVSIVASGAGNSSDVHVRGSEISAGNNVNLKAEGDVLLESSKDKATLHSSNKSSGGSIGVGISLGSSNGITLSAGVNAARGNANGDDVIQQNTHVVAGNTVTIQSGADTTLAGATVTAPMVKADVGGDLNIESRQDSSSFESKQKSAGAGVTLCIPPICYGSSSVSVSGGKQNIDSNLQSVTEQSGIRAGDGGFQVHVAQDTTLTGGAITSTDKAVNEGKNSFDTGGSLTMSDVQNHAQYQGEGFEFNATFASNSSGQEVPKGHESRVQQEALAPKTGGGAGVGEDSGSASSVTISGISGIAGNEAMRTGDAETGVKPIFDKEKVQRELDAQIKITAEFGRQAAKSWGEYANGRFANAKNEEEARCWGPDGACRAGGHALLGGLGGGVAGALGAGLTSTAAPHVAGYLVGQGVEPSTAAALTGLLALGVGSAAGGAAAGAGAFNEAAQNNLLLINALNGAVQQAQRLGPGGLRLLDQAGQAVLRTCASSSVCMNLLPAAAAAWLAAQLTQEFEANQPSLADQIPGYGDGPQPKPTGPLVNIPVEKDAKDGLLINIPNEVDASVPGYESEKPKGAYEGTITLNPKPPLDLIMLAVPPGDKEKLNAGLQNIMGGMPILEPEKNSSNEISRYENGTYNDAQSVFDQLGLVNIGEFMTSAGPGKEGTLPDGTRVIVRPSSSDGTPTIQIIDVNRSKPRTVQEIRFGQGKK